MGAQRLFKVALLFVGLHGALVHHVVRGLLAHLFAQFEHHFFRQQQAALHVEIAAHARFIHRHAAQNGDGVLQLRREVNADFRQRDPLGAPAHGVALVLDMHRFINQRGAFQHRCGQAGQPFQRGGVALVRHGGRADLAGGERLLNLVDLGAHQVVKLVADFAQRAADQHRHGGELREAVARRLPADIRRRQPENIERTLFHFRA